MSQKITAKTKHLTKTAKEKQNSFGGSIASQKDQYRLNIFCFLFFIQPKKAFYGLVLTKASTRKGEGDLKKGAESSERKLVKPNHRGINNIVTVSYWANKEVLGLVGLRL